MNRLPYSARAFFAGLCVSQIIATLHVYLSNAHLYNKLTVIRESGYLAVPNLEVMEHLRNLAPAFFGGLFFTFSAGAGISIGALAAVWAWDRLLSRNKVLLIPFLLLWAFCLLIVNIRAVCPMVSLYFLAIPPVIFVLALRWMPPRSGERVWLNFTVGSAPIILLALLWAPHLDSHIFLKLRDHFLLSNRLGTTINDFYYKYTLYPAEAFKSPEQKMLKTCSLENIEKLPIRRLLETKLLNHDYLNIVGAREGDLEISPEGKGLVFENGGRTILTTTLDDFLSRRSSTLAEFSRKSDRYFFFRRFTFFSLLIGFPITLYIFVHAVLYSMFGLFLVPQRALVLASIVCLLAGIMLYTPFYRYEGGDIKRTDLARMLDGEDWEERVRALRAAYEKGVEVADFPNYEKMLTSPHIPERYWFTKALGVSRRPETRKDILALLDDPHPNVISMAYQALGQRRNRGAIDEILERLKRSNDWYNQWYAYKALRSLGWKQKKSN
ncbi:MAG: HEAT repeat domain-containing protein [Desulfobacteraceae bacterium]|nr:HEAT repeat domain-containing protein [Desulfobacteraceae bacterium]